MARLFQFGWVVLVVLGCSGNQPQVAEGPENVPGESQTVEEPHDAPAAVQSEKSRTPVALPELKPLPIPELPDGVTLPNSIEEWQTVINRRDSLDTKFDPVFHRALIHPDDNIRVAAYERVHPYKVHPPEVLPFFVAGISDSVEDIRARVVDMALRWREAGAQAVPALIHCAADPDENILIRRDAIFALGGIGPDAAAAIPYFSTEIDDPQSETAGYCLIALTKLGPQVQTIMPSLIRELNSEGTSMNREGHAAAVLLMLEQTDAVLKRYKAATPETRKRLLEGVRALEDRTPGLPLIRLGIEDADDDVRVEAMYLLASSKGTIPDAMAIASSRLTDSNEQVRNNAALMIENSLKALTTDSSLDRGQLYDQLRPMLVVAHAYSNQSRKIIDAILGLGPQIQDKLWHDIRDETESDAQRAWAMYLATRLIDNLAREEKSQWREKLREFTQPEMPSAVRGLALVALLNKDEASDAEMAVIVEAARLELPDVIHVQLLTGLAKLGNTQALDEMFQAGRSQSDYLQQAGFDAIRTLGPRSSPLAPRILQILSNEEDDGTFGRWISCLSLMNLPGETLAEPLLNVATQPQFQVQSRLAAIQTLGEFSDQADDIAPRLCELLQSLKSQANSLRSELIVTLSKLGPAAAPATPVVIELLNSDDNWVHSYCVQFLSRAGPAGASAAPRLFSLLNETGNDYERADILAALASVAPSDPKVLAAVVEGVRNPNDTVRPEAVRLLKGLQDNARPAFDEILAIYQAAPITDDYTARKFREDLHTILKQLAPNDPRVPEEP